jgi:hypothetical protein
MNDLEQLIDIPDYIPTTEDIYHHIKYVHTLLSKHNIKHFLLYGTLLGCIRNKDIIPYDYDFDFGIIHEDYNTILSLPHDDPHYKFEPTTGTLYSKASSFKTPETKFRVSLAVVHNDMKVGDLYIYTNCKDGFTRRYDPNEKILFWPRSVFPTCLIDTLDEGCIRDLKLPIPKYGVVLLEYFYGPMWQTPIKAMSQGGSNDDIPEYDYYAGYIYSSLHKLIERTKEEFHKGGEDVVIGEPQLKEEDVEYVFPLDQIEWVKDNEGVVLKTKKKKK